MDVKRTADGGVVITMTRAEADQLSFQISVTDTAWRRSDYLRSKYERPSDLPLSKLHRGLVDTLNDDTKGDI